MSADDALIFVGMTDLAGLLRGKAFPASDWQKRSRRGVGWTPTNVQINCWDKIAETPFGALGDLVLLPDVGARLQLDGDGEAPALDILLGDILSLEGEPWDFCTRSLAKRALRELRQTAGLELRGAFEHEFQLIGETPRPGDAYSFRGFRAGQQWAEALMTAMRQVGIAPDTFMKEFGPLQYEVTCGPSMGVTVADEAAFVRVLVGEMTRRFGRRASFAPVLDPSSVGNGVHIHLSLHDTSGAPATYDADAPFGLTEQVRFFIGGVLAHLDEIIAILAPSDVSYLRLTPHRWSAAFNNLGFRDREAAIRICPVTALDEEEIARQFNVEVRACDAAASPHLALAAIVFAGAEGLRARIEPPPTTEEDLSEWSDSRLAEAGLKRLPLSLPEALERFEASQAVRRWFGAEFVRVYADHKRSEMAALAGLDALAKCARYAGVY